MVKDRGGKVGRRERYDHHHSYTVRGIKQRVSVL